MTREEATRRIARFKKTSDGTYEWETLVNTDDLKAFEMAIKALKAIDEIIDYLHDGSVTWRDITDDIIADIVNKYMGNKE